MKKLIILIFGAMILSPQLMAQNITLIGNYTFQYRNYERIDVTIVCPENNIVIGNESIFHGDGFFYVEIFPFECTHIIVSAPGFDSKMYLVDLSQIYIGFTMIDIDKELEYAYHNGYGTTPDVVFIDRNYPNFFSGNVKIEIIDNVIEPGQGAGYQWQRKIDETWVDIGERGKDCYLYISNEGISWPIQPILLRRVIEDAQNGYYGCSDVIHVFVYETDKAVGAPDAKAKVGITKQIYTEPQGLNPVINVTYIDGFGREIQNVSMEASPSGKDIIGITKYDVMGRADSITYLPYVGDSSNDSSKPDYSQKQYYTQKIPGNDGNYAFLQKIYDNSVEGLVLKEGGLGHVRSVTAGHPVEFDYRTNTQSDQIKKYTVRSDSILEYSGYYPAGVLSVRKISTSGSDDTQNKEFYEYIDCEGRLIAREERVTVSDRRFTYFVFDQLGRQRYMIPPIQDEKITATRTYTLDELKTYCFYTEYDKNGRVVKEYVPGAEYVVNLYDRRGRLVLVQTGNMREESKWRFIKYDELNRPVMTGVYSGGTYASHLAAINAQMIFGEKRSSDIHGYTNLSYPEVQSENDVLAVSYFDDYDWVSDAGFSSVDALGNSPNYDVVGLSTGTKTKVLGVDNHQWLRSVIYYDTKYNVVQTINDLYPAGREIVSNKHNFQGVVTQARVKQVIGNQTNEYLKTFTYDRMGRLLSIKQQITGDAENGEVTLVSYTYDDLGTMATKSIHNGLDTECYDYNIAGMIISASSPSFSYRLGFENAVVDSVSTRYDGNLSQIAWSGAEGRQRAYSYSYDKLGQMTDATFFEKGSGGWTATTKYSENRLQYDKNGNILALKRSDNTGGVLHDIDYYYDGNAVLALVLNDSISAFYEYDKNGNMTFDGRTGIGIEYNILGLPQRIFAGAENITYIYSATGEKLASKVDGSLTYYRSVMVYNGDQLSQILHPEGFTTCIQTGKYQYNYLKRDHLGSTRQMLAALASDSGGAGSGGATTMQVVQETDYYAFGLAHSINNLHVNKYLFSGKELQDASIAGELLGLYDFGARYYDPLVGRWFNIDPKATKYPDISPYAYCANNPTMFIDPNGEDWYFCFDGLYLGEHGPGPDVRIMESWLYYDLTGMSMAGGFSWLPEIYHKKSVLFSIGMLSMSDQAIVNVFKHFYEGIYGISAEYRGDNSLARAEIGLYEKNYNWTTMKGAKFASGEIFLNLSKIKGSTLFDNGYNIMNLMFHENFHIEDALSNPDRHAVDRRYNTGLDEMRAIDAQQDHESWAKATQEWRNVIHTYHLNNILTSGYILLNWKYPKKIFPWLY